MKPIFSPLIPILLGTLAALSSASSSFAEHGNGAGNGGAALLIHGQFCLLDLAQSGVCANPYTNPAMVPSAELLEKIRAFYPEITPKVAQLLGSKIVELKTINAPLALALESRLTLHKYFAVVSNGELRNPYFEKSPIRYEEMELYRLALRIEPMIYLSPYVFPKLSNAQKAATLFHELFSAFTHEDGDTEVTREFVSQIYKRGVPREIMQETLRKVNDFTFSSVLMSWNRLQKNIEEGLAQLTEYPKRFVVTDLTDTLEIITFSEDEFLGSTKLENAAKMSPGELEAALQKICDQIAQVTKPGTYRAAIQYESFYASEYRYDPGYYQQIPFRAGRISRGINQNSGVLPGPDCSKKLMDEVNYRAGRI